MSEAENYCAVPFSWPQGCQRPLFSHLGFFCWIQYSFAKKIISFSSSSCLDISTFCFCITTNSNFYLQYHDIDIFNGFSGYWKWYQWLTIANWNSSYCGSYNVYSRKQTRIIQRKQLLISVNLRMLSHMWSLRKVYLTLSTGTHYSWPFWLAKGN